MAWWGWLITAWVVVACVAGIWLGLALTLAEKRDRVRRGSAAPAVAPRTPTRVP